MDVLLFSLGVALVLVCAAAVASRFFVTTPEGYVGVLTAFGGFRRLTRPGITMRSPWERVLRLSLQNRSMDAEFDVVTAHDRTLRVNCLLLYRVAGADEATVRRATFAFASERDLVTSIRRLLEDEFRSHAATLREHEVGGIGPASIARIKAALDARLRDWGYCVEDLRCHHVPHDAVAPKSYARHDGVAPKSFLATAPITVMRGNDDASR